MRQLTAAELELISGGDGSENEIVVTGSPYPSPSPQPMPGAPWPGQYPGGSPSPSPSGGPPPPPTYMDTNCAVNALHTQTDASSNVNTNEHFGIVYHNASGYHTSPLFTGTDQGSISTITNWMAANGVSFSQVTSLFHNHDAYDYATSSDEAALNRYPSSNDWNAANYFIQNGANASVFTLSLEDTDHVVRDFNYTNESTYKNLSTDQKINGTDLPGKAPAC